MTSRPRRRELLAAILICSAALNGYHLHWGLPNGNTTWAADAITPLTPLSVAKKSFAQWNSGWFYFKYPIGHPLLLAGAYTPYLGGLYFAGEFRSPQSRYPYGFRDPERALAVLAMIGRVVSLLMATAIVWIVHALGTLLFGPTAALFGAAAAATSMVLIFYAHTTNLDVPVTFWMLLAVLFALRLTREVRWIDCCGLGVAAGIGFATKESAVGMLVPLPAVIAVWQLSRLRPLQMERLRPVVARLALGAVIGLLVYGAASNGFYNPAGLFNRWRFLTNTLPSEYFGSLVPRAAYIDVTEGPSLATHWRLLREFWASSVEAVGIPLFTASLCGVALAAVRAPKTVLLAGCLLVSYYWFSLAALPLVAVRYVLPSSMLLSPFAGAFLAAVATRGLVRRVAVVATLATGLVYGGSVDHLLAHDPRYDAESWLARNAIGRSVETYNRATFLPRMPEGVRHSQPRFEEISRLGVEHRRPDFIVLNLADVGRVTGRYDTFEVGVRRRPENEEFLRGLLAEEVGYRRVARFQARSLLLRDGVIRSLNPEIIVFARS